MLSLLLLLAAPAVAQQHATVVDGDTLRVAGEAVRIMRRTAR
jgi:endonuclease YncB( thermonuclease family)